MRQSLKLSIVLPVLFCALEGILWYWEIHSRHTVPGYLGNLSPAIPIRSGLDFPAVLAAVLSTKLCETFSEHVAAGIPERLVVFAFVAGSWCLIGYWLDHRAAREGRWKPYTLRPWVVACQLAVLAFGVFTLLFSSHVHPFSFAEVTERALLQTWAAFLIGVPALAIINPAVHDTESAHRPRMHVSNFRGFMIALGLFAALLIFGVVTSPNGVK